MGKNKYSYDKDGKKLYVGDVVLSYPQNGNGTRAYTSLIGTICTVTKEKHVLVDFTNTYGPEKQKRIEEELDEASKALNEDFDLNWILMEPAELRKLPWHLLSETEQQTLLNDDESCEKYFQCGRF